MQVYLVGGAVRDSLLGLPVHERDWVVVGSNPDEMIQRGFSPVGKEFPVFLHPETREEYALARTERKSGHGYKGFAVDSSPHVTLEEDLLRRDLTINAMARDNRGNLIDPCGGQQDLHNRTLRHVSDAFAEDPLRVLRVARFAARFHHLGFIIAAETLQLMQRLVTDGEMAYLVPERIWKEFHSALCEQHPHVFIDVLRACHALRAIMPEIDRLFGVPQRKDYHPEIDAGLHALLSLEQAARITDDARVRFAALVHDLGKAETPADILPRHIGHETRSLPLIRQFCQRLAVPHDYRDLALIAAEYHTHCHRSGELNADTVYKVLKACRAFQQPELLERFLQTCEADAHGRTGLEHNPYPQAERFRKALHACQQVVTADVQRDGYEGVALGNEIRRRQVAAIAQFAPKQVSQSPAPDAQAT